MTSRLLAFGTRVRTFSADGGAVAGTVVDGPSGTGLYKVDVGGSRPVVRHRSKLEVI